MSLSRIVKVDPGKTAFFICDLQERIRTSWGVIWKFDDIVYTANKMLKMAKILNVPVLTTEQHPRVFGSTVPELKYDHLESLNLGVFAKTKFSMITQEVEEVIRRSDITGVVMMGIESQICITQIRPHPHHSWTMASRIAVQSLRGSSSLLRRQATAIPRLAAVPSRQYSDASRPPPEQRANAMIESLPGNSLISKTGTVVLGTGVFAAAISQELYVVNEETIVLVGTAIMFTLLARILKDPYKEWSEGHINRIRNVLNTTRKEHTQAVTARIDSVQQMKDVVDVTKGLFALSKETAKLEHEAFAQRQKVAVAAEVKAVLDSWVRYEQQEKESEQADLAKAVIERVTKSLTDAKNQQEILNSAISEVEQLVKSKAI